MWGTFGAGRRTHVPGSWRACCHQRSSPRHECGLLLADSRRIELLANGLPLWQDSPVAITTLVCPLTRSEEPRPGAEHEPGLALQTSTNRKKRAVYPESVAARQCEVGVLGLQVGGRIGQQGAVSARLRAAARQANIHRWTGMLAVAAQFVFAMSLLELSLGAADDCDGAEPPLAEVLADAKAIDDPGRGEQTARRCQIAVPVSISRGQKVQKKRA